MMIFQHPSSEEVFPSMCPFVGGIEVFDQAGYGRTDRRPSPGQGRSRISTFLLLVAAVGEDDAWMKTRKKERKEEEKHAMLKFKLMFVKQKGAIMCNPSASIPPGHSRPSPLENVLNIVSCSYTSMCFA